MWTEHVWILSFVSVLAGNFSHWLFILEMFLCRSIRALCNSWDTFAKIAVGEKVCDQLSSKKRKVLPDSSDVPAPCLIPSLEKARSSLENRGTDRYNGLEYQQAEHQFNRAEKCLFSLKDSIESLHQKKLFPYNPEALLKRYLQLRFFCSLFRLVFVTYVKPLFMWYVILYIFVLWHHVRWRSLPVEAFLFAVHFIFTYPSEQFPVNAYWYYFIWLIWSAV